MTATRRYALRVAAMIGAGATVAACGPGDLSLPFGPTAAPAITLKVQVWDDIQDKDVYDGIAEDFAKARPNVKVLNDHQINGQGQPGYYEKFEKGVAAGSPNDLVYFQGWQWQSYAAAGSLQELDDRAARDMWTLPWPADEAYELQTKFRAKRYLSTSNIGTMVMFYVKEYFDRAGVAYPKPDWTIADFQDAARKVTRTDDKGQVYGYQWNPGYLRNTPWWRMNGRVEWDRIAEPKQANWAATEVVEALQWQLVDSQYAMKVSPTQATLEQSQEANRLEFGNVAMKVEGPWFLPRMWGAKAKRPGGTPFDVQLLPTGRTGKKVHLNLVEGQVIAKASKVPDAAWDLMKWISGDEGQKRIAEGGRMCNVPETNRRFWLPLATQRYNVANAEAFLKAIETGTINLVGSVTEAVLDRDAELSRTLDRMRYGQLSAKDAMEALQPKIQQVLDATWAKQGGA